MYSIYCLYTNDNEIYIGLSKNPRARIEQHCRKSCNFRLRELFESGSKQIFSTILHSGLTQQEASQLEKVLIKKYRDDPDYTILNVQSGGIRGNAKIEKSPKIPKVRSKHLTADEIVKLRLRFRALKQPFNYKELAKEYNIAASYLKRILKGQVRRNVAGPLLGKDY